MRDGALAVLVVLVLVLLASRLRAAEMHHNWCNMSSAAFAQVRQVLRMDGDSGSYDRLFCQLLGLYFVEEKRRRRKHLPFGKFVLHSLDGSVGSHFIRPDQNLGDSVPFVCYTANGEKLVMWWPIPACVVQLGTVQYESRARLGVASAFVRRRFWLERTELLEAGLLEEGARARFAACAHHLRLAPRRTALAHERRQLQVAWRRRCLAFGQRHFVALAASTGCPVRRDAHLPVLARPWPAQHGPEEAEYVRIPLNPTPEWLVRTVNTRFYNYKQTCRARLVYNNINQTMSIEFNEELNFDSATESDLAYTKSERVFEVEQPIESFTRSFFDMFDKMFEDFDLSEEGKVGLRLRPLSMKDLNNCLSFGHCMMAIGLDQRTHESRARVLQHDEPDRWISVYSRTSGTRWLGLMWGNMKSFVVEACQKAECAREYFGKTDLQTKRKLTFPTCYQLQHSASRVFYKHRSANRSLYRQVTAETVLCGVSISRRLDPATHRVFTDYSFYALPLNVSRSLREARYDETTEMVAGGGPEVRRDDVLLMQELYALLHRHADARNLGKAMPVLCRSKIRDKTQLAYLCVCTTVTQRPCNSNDVIAPHVMDLRRHPTTEMLSNRRAATICMNFALHNVNDQEISQTDPNLMFDVELNSFCVYGPAHDHDMNDVEEYGMYVYGQARYVRPRPTQRTWLRVLPQAQLTERRVEPLVRALCAGPTWSAADAEQACKCAYVAGLDDLACCCFWAVAASHRNNFHPQVFALHDHYASEELRALS